jgi:hypothetical protein
MYSKDTALTAVLYILERHRLKSLMVVATNDGKAWIQGLLSFYSHLKIHTVCDIDERAYLIEALRQMNLEAEYTSLNYANYSSNAQSIFLYGNSIASFQEGRKANRPSLDYKSLTEKDPLAQRLKIPDEFSCLKELQLLLRDRS